MSSLRQHGQWRLSGGIMLQIAQQEVADAALARQHACGF